MSVAKIGGRRGRPRLPSTDRAIYAAAAALIREKGYDGFSMAAVADRAGVAKTTVYRRWPTRAHLVLETLSSVMRPSLFDSGDLRADLIAFAFTTAAGLRAQGTRRLVAELTLAVTERPDLAEAMRRLYNQRRGAALASLYRAQKAGELRPDVDPDLLIDQVSGTLHYQMLLADEAPTDAYAERLVDAVLEGALPHGADV